MKRQYTATLRVVIEADSTSDAINKMAGVMPATDGPLKDWSWATSPRLQVDAEAMQLNESGGLPLPSGGCIDAPDFFTGEIRRRDEHGNVEETRYPVNDDYWEWADRFPGSFTRCEECGKMILKSSPSGVNEWHLPSCSLHTGSEGS